MQQKTVVNSMFWKFAERCGAQGITILVSIILARLLDPASFGAISLVLVFTTFMDIFIDSGMGVALIQKKNADDVDFSSVFYFNVFFGLLLYLLMFFAAPFIAGFYRMPELTPLVRVISLSLVISSLRNVQHAYVSKNMLFRRFFYATLGGTFASAVISIAMAYAGFGIWALVVQSLSNTAISTLILWLTVQWRPHLLFSFGRLRSLLSFGWKLLATKLIDKVYEDLRVLVIGRMYAPQELAYYNQGAQIPYGVINNVNTTIDAVLLPSISAEQDNKERVKSMMRRAVKMGSFIMAPFMLGLVAVCEPFVSLVLTDKWLPCVPFMRLFCIAFLFYPINTANLNGIKAMGRSDIILKLEIIKKILGISMILITMWISVLAMAYGMLVCSIANQFINAYPNKRLLNYSYIEQLKDIFPNIALSAVMGVFVYLLGAFPLNNILLLILQIVLGGLFFFASARLLHIESYADRLSVVNSYRKKRK